MNSKEKCQLANISCLWYENRQVAFDSVASFENQENIPRKAVAQLSDVVGKQFSSMSDQRRIEHYFDEKLAAA